MEITNSIIRKSLIVNTTLESAWKLWTTHEGLKLFFGVDNEIELLIGGKYEIYFLMNNPIGIKGSESCKVLSYLPNEMLSFSWNAPPQFKKVRESKYKTWVVIQFREVEERKTEVILSHLGWPNQKDWNEVFEYFNLAWDHVMKDFKKLFEDE